MPEIIFQKGQVMRVKVTSIVENVKQIPKGNDLMQRHDIYLEDDKGNTARCEFLNHSLECKEFVPGVWQYVRCQWPNPKGSEIEPYDPEATAAPMPPQRPALPHGTSIPNANQEPPAINHAIAADVNVGGKAIVFAMAYAKDIKCAEISKRKAGPVTDQDIEDVIKWGKQIRMGLLDFDAY